MSLLLVSQLVSGYIELLQNNRDGSTQRKLVREFVLDKLLDFLHSPHFVFQQLGTLHSKDS